MKKTTKKIVHVIISLIYIIWGIGAPLTALNAIIDLNPAALLSAATGLIMLIAGVLGLLRLKPIYRRVLGIIIFVLAASSAVTSLAGGSLAWQAIIQAVMAWFYIVW